MKFLIDECLSPELANLAETRGHHGSAHVTRRGMGCWEDRKIMPKIIDGDWTFVTQNSDDFRPPVGSTSTRPCYVGYPLHAGLVCLNLKHGSRLKDQMAYFQAALDFTGCPGDLVNVIVEVDPSENDPKKIKLRHYDFPSNLQGLTLGGAQPPTPAAP